MKANIVDVTIEITESLKAIAHPTRIKILLLLNSKAKRAMTVTEIQESLELTQPETSRHLLVMRSHKVLMCNKEGSWAYYSIDTGNPVANCFVHYLSKHLN